jgi:hypothetical protein
VDGLNWLHLPSFSSSILFYSITSRISSCYSKDRLKLLCLTSSFSEHKNYPFHKTLDTLSVWFIKNADDVAAAAAMAPPPTTTLTINTGPLVRTPPRVARSNPRSSFQEVRNYTTITGGTPGKSHK